MLGSMVISFPFSFQFFTRLAAAFAEEVGYFVLIAKCRHIQRSHTIYFHRIHICATSDE